MKFLTFIDVHQDKKAIKKLVTRAKKSDIDFIICGGDISDFGRGLREGLSAFNAIGKKCYFIPGNHEEHLSGINDLLKEFPNIFTEGSYVFLGYGGDGFSTQNPEFRQLAREWYSEFKDKKVIFITHGPPANTAIDLLGERHVGNLDYRKFVERIKPKLYVCGHLHETVGQSDHIGETKLVNPGWDGLVIELTS
jgi:uncharacterized protein